MAALETLPPSAGLAGKYVPSLVAVFHVMFG